MRLLFFVLFVAALLPSVYGHVRLYRTDITGAVNTAPIRNAPSATSDGAFSVNGPCGGTLVWGKNGAANVKAGDTIKLTIGYNGGHADAGNVFRATFACGKPDNDAALRAATAVLTNVPTQKEPSSAVANRHTFTITLPAPPTNVANADKCTVSVLDQRNWGGCIDLQYPAAVTPATTSAPGNGGNGGGQTTAPAAGGATTTKAPAAGTTTTTAAPPALNTAKLNGGYIIGMGCDSTAPGCCCIQGTLNAQISADKSTLTFTGNALRSNCPGEPKISQQIITKLQADGSYKSEEITIRGEPFTAEVIADKRQVILTNVADDKPSTCSFTATKPPSLDDRANAACSPPTPAQVQACLASIPTLPDCEDNRPADFDTTKCCVTCKPAVLPPKPKCPLDDLPRCAEGTTPLISTVTGCPSCVQVIQKKCPIDPRNITACPPGVRPQRGANDCVTCQPKPDEKCTPKARAECAKKIADGALPPCELSLDQSYVAEFDVDTCCRKCVPPAEQDKPANGVKCTPVEVKQCMDKTPICEDGEKPVKNATKCCPTCKRAERDCRIQDVALCRRNTTVCAPGEVPVNVPGECCQTCRPAPPKCTPACTNATICIRDITPGSTLAQRLAAPGRCFPRRNIVARLDVTSINKTVDEASVKALIQEMIERFCELPVKKNLCGATEISRMDIAVQILAIVKTGGKTWAEVRIGFATQARVVNGVFRLQSEAEITAADACWADDACTTNTDSTELFTSAFSDASSTGDVTVTDVTVEGQPDAPTDAPTDDPSVDPNNDSTTRKPRPGTTTSGAISSTSVSFVSIVLSFVFIVRNF